MINKEKIYDDRIAPLMSQIIEICKEEEIPVFAQFQYGEQDFVTTLIPHGGHCVLRWMEILGKCAEEDGVNIDKFMFSLMKSGVHNKSSVVMKLLGEEPKNT